ncbi:hypothetical protein F0U59_07595 [Archangium gephyra]|nr:hypothetical protein F0U59_07595 [Archangium gephyra]
MPSAPSAAEVQGLGGVTGTAAGLLHSMAVRSDGTVWTWGSNWDGQLGNALPAIATLPSRSLL